MENGISIIVPVYNAERYIERCINSLVMQTYNDLEIILVDDGSQDDSGYMCQKWAEKDKRIKYIFQPNSGVSVARNVGLKNATAQYVTFVDADDYIELDYCSKMIQILIDEESELVYCGTKDIYPDGRTVLQGQDSGEIYTWKSREFEYYGCKDHRTVWGVLYRRIILENLFFDTELFVGEDSLFFAQAILQCSNISYYDRSLYNYMILENSACHGYFDEKKYTEIFAWKKICALFHQYPQIELSARARCAETCAYMTARYINDDVFCDNYLDEIIAIYRKNLFSLLKFDVKKRRRMIKHLVIGAFPKLRVKYLKKKYRELI